MKQISVNISGSYEWCERSQDNFYGNEGLDSKIKPYHIFRMRRSEVRAFFSKTLQCRRLCLGSKVISEENHLKIQLKSIQFIKGRLMMYNVDATV